MAVTLKADVAGAIPKFIKQEVESTFADRLYMPWLVTRDFSDEVANDGDRVTVNDYGVGTAQDAAGGFTPEALSEGSTVVIMDSWKTAAFSIDNQASSMGIHDWKKVIRKRITEPMGNVIEDALQGLYTDATTNNYTATGTNGGLTYNDLPKLSRLLKDVNADLNPQGRYNFILSGFDEQELLLISKMVDANLTGDGGAAIKNGHIGTHSGFDFFRSNRVPSSGTSPITYHSMAFGESAMAFVTRAPSTLIGSNAVQSTFTDPRTGITMRIVMSFNHTGGFVDTVSVDFMYGVKTMNESHMIDITSQETPA